ncbi:MAG: hypothetical protein Q9217_005238 [Psora testacea]
MSSHEAPSSHGRGGAGNIAPDSDTIYVDGEIVREGPIGDQGDGAYSTGRGGAGNINSPGLKPTKKQPGDVDVVPETAIRRSGEGHENYHVGRGGEGNAHKEKHEKHGLMDKVKEKLGGKKDGE